MKVLEVSKILLENLKPCFEEHGFILNNKKREFERETNNCSQMFSLFFYKQNEHIAVKPEIKIKIAAIEGIYKSITSNTERPYLTIGNHLFEILRYMDKGEEIGKSNKVNWLIKDQGDIEKLIKVVPEYLRETILPYFDENSSIDRIDYLLNKLPHELSIHNYIYPLRANIAVIAAKLNQNPRYNDLVNLYEKELEDAEETYKEEFYKIKETLQNY